MDVHGGHQSDILAKRMRTGPAARPQKSDSVDPDPDVRLTVRRRRVKPVYQSLTRALHTPEKGTSFGFFKLGYLNNCLTSTCPLDHESDVSLFVDSNALHCSFDSVEGGLERRETAVVVLGKVHPLTGEISLSQQFLNGHRRGRQPNLADVGIGRMLDACAGSCGHPAFRPNERRKGKEGDQQQRAEAAHGHTNEAHTFGCPGWELVEVTVGGFVPGKGNA